jgi:hypothetical protein
VGINTFVGVERDGTPLTSVTRTGMFVLPQRDEWSAPAVGANPRAVGWLVGDECEMGLNGCDGGTEYQNLAIMRSWVSQLRSLNDGRFLYTNFGNGVLGTFWARNTMRQFVQALDASSVDKYAYTSPHNAELIAGSPHWPRGAAVARSATYGWLARRMRTFQDPRRIRPTWVFVETAKPYLTEAGARTITPEQVEGAVWAAITNEARGIVYFQHNNDSRCATYSIVDCGPALRNRLASVHAEIRRLAPVLNTQSYRWNFRSGTDTMLKRHGGSAYVFASLGVRDEPGTKTFTLPGGVNGATVAVVGEGRTLPVRNRRFTDTFARESSHHVYRVSLSR